MLMKRTSLLAASAALALTAGSTQAATVVSDFTGWSESGGLLPSPNTLEQDFSTSGTEITVAYNSSPESAVGQETFMTDEFATLATGDRISVELGAFGTSPAVTHTFGLVVGNVEVTTSRTNLVGFLFKTNGQAQLINFDASGGYTTVNNVSIAANTDTLFIEKTAAGWSFGGINTSDAEALYFTNINAVGAGSITADGSAVGIWSDLRTVNGSSTLNNFTYVPEPGSLALFGLGGLLVARRRRA